MTFSASILSLNVEIPEFIINPPVVALKPLPAVMIPTASTFVTSSYVSVPAIDTFPLNAPSPVTSSNDPLNVKFALSSSSPPVPARTTRPEVRSSTLNVFA